MRSILDFITVIDLLLERYGLWAMDIAYCKLPTMRMSMKCSSQMMTNVFPLTVFVFLALANVLRVLSPLVGVPISKEFADWCFWWSTILSAPGQIALVLGSTTFLVDGHRRQRMGISGVLHAVSNMIAIASGQMWKFGTILGLFDDIQSGKILFLFWVSGYLSLAFSMGILWMIPVLSKRISRVFAGFIIGTGVALSLCAIPWLGLPKYSQLSDTAFKRSAHGIGLFFFLCLPIMIINVMDTYATCFLLKTKRAFFKKRSKTTCTPARGMIRKSSARGYKPESRIFFRAFRKCEILQYMFPLTEPDGVLMHTSIYGVRHDQKGVRADHIFWLAFSLLEMTGVVVVTCIYMLDPERIVLDVGGINDPFFFGISSYGVYAVLSFALTLLVKGKVTADQFLAIIATEGIPQTFRTFLLPDSFLCLKPVSIAVAATTIVYVYYNSEPEQEDEYEEKDQ